MRVHRMLPALLPLMLEMFSSRNPNLSADTYSFMVAVLSFGKHIKNLTLAIVPVKPQGQGHWQMHIYVQMYRHILHDLNLLDSSTATPVYNDNLGAVDWSNSFSHKGMTWTSMRMQFVRLVSTVRSPFRIFLARPTQPIFSPRSLNRIPHFAIFVAFSCSTHFPFPCLDSLYGWGVSSSFFWNSKLFCFKI